jgi:hypothetical protein
MNNLSEKDFYFQLIKGKIAEQVFELMFRETRKYTVIPFGYESIIPELAQYLDSGSKAMLFENIRSAPDFALISHEPEHVYLVEVKYRHSCSSDNLREMAAKIHEKWKLAYLFLATPKGFYFDKCSEIMIKGELAPLPDSFV